jgi:hypothetical protein
MKLINHFLLTVIDYFLTSATPNLFGSQRRRKEKGAEAASYRNVIREGQAKTQAELDKEIAQTVSTNPFEGAAAKSAMATASRKAKQAQKRFGNIMGGTTNPEAIIAAQQATQEAVSGTAGDIAVGADAQKQSKLDALRREKRASRAGYAAQEAIGTQMKEAAINERGAGWRDFFSIFGKSLGGGAQGAISAMGSK